MICIRSLSRKFAKTVALHPIDLDIEKGETLAVVGPSGAGKTTLLRCIAGLDINHTGSVTIDGYDSATYLKHRRPAMVFQRYANFHWMTVRENLEHALMHRGINRKERQQSCEQMLDVVGLTGCGKMYISALSGGMQQRVAVARALLQDNDIILLDEPFGALDIANRAILQDFIKNYFHDRNKTSIFVTHDPVEAIYVGDRILLLSERPETPHQIFESPSRGISKQTIKESDSFLKLQFSLTQNLIMSTQQEQTSITKEP